MFGLKKGIEGLFGSEIGSGFEGLDGTHSFLNVLIGHSRNYGRTGQSTQSIPEGNVLTNVLSFLSLTAIFPTLLFLRNTCANPLSE